MEETNSKKKYVVLIEKIKEMIEEGVYKSGEKIPSEKEIMEANSLSRDTVRKAINFLVADNYLNKIQGSGTFVNENALSQSLLTFYSFTDEMKKKGKKPTSKIISFLEVDITERIKSKMKTKNSKVWELVRLRLADGEVIMYEKTYLNKDIISNLTLSQVGSKPLYELIKGDYNIKFERAIEKFKAILPTEEILEALEMKTLKACLRLERFTYSLGEVIEYTSSVARGDKLTFEIELK